MSFISKNYKIAIGIIIGLIISGICAYATTTFKSSDVTYDNSSSGLTSTNLQGAIDELNTKAKNIYSKKNENIVAAYGNSSICITGEESTCVETTCYTSNASGSCATGTIIKYKVNSSTTKYFHVFHDDGETLTMQQRENTTANGYWNSVNVGTSGGGSSGPITVLSELESATSGWSNVNSQTYTMGTTAFGTGNNAYTGCTVSGCTTNTYTLDSRTAKARMITMQEALALGCTGSSQSCPNWMNNYLYNSTSNGGTVDDGNDSNGKTRYGYWTMSGSSSSMFAWNVDYFGDVSTEYTYSSYYGARAVVVINK